MGLIPGGAYRNRNHVAQLLEAGNTDEMYVDLLSDPQTSGGLLAAVPEEEKDAILDFLKELDSTRYLVIESLYRNRSNHPPIPVQIVKIEGE